MYASDRKDWRLIGRLAVMGLAAGVTVTALSGCTTYSGAPNECQAHQGGIPFVVTLRGCSVQLNADWAVTAKHVKMILPHGVADPDQDLYFFRHEGPAPVWRDPQPGEAVSASGNPWNPIDLTGLTFALPLREETAGTVEGTTTISPQLGGAGTPMTVFHAHALPGYSGGPLRGADGAVLGVIFGRVESAPQVNTTGLSIQIGDGLAIPSSAVLAAFERDVLTR